MMETHDSRPVDYGWHIMMMSVQVTIGQVMKTKFEAKHIYVVIVSTQKHGACKHDRYLLRPEETCFGRWMMTRHWAKIEADVSFRTHIIMHRPTWYKIHHVLT